MVFMGVKGAATYFSQRSIVHECPSTTQRKSPGWSRCFQPEHVMFDMNCILHTAFTVNTLTVQEWIERTKKLVKTLLNMFPPSKGLFIVFDGIAPLSKLIQQRERRRHVPESAGFLPLGFESKKLPFSHEEITAGSPFAYVCEKELQAWFPTLLQDLGLKVELSWSGSLEPGEGEIKMSSYLQRCPLIDAADSIILIGNDSDLVFVSIVATRFTALCVVDPSSFLMTTVSQLLDMWSKSVPNPPLHAHILVSYRVDFTFIMLLAGCDFYAGIMRDVGAVWKTYRHLRENGGFFKNSLINISKDGEFDLDVNFLKTLLSKAAKHIRSSHKASRPRAADGAEVLRGAMWVLQSMVLGNCVNPNYTCKIGSNSQVPFTSLVEAVHLKNIRTTILDVLVAPPWVQQPSQFVFSLLEQYIGVMGKRGRYSAGIKSAINLLDDKGNVLNTSTSLEKIVKSVKGVMANVRNDCLLTAEREMHHFE